jgi:hypothetical protein
MSTGEIEAAAKAYQLAYDRATVFPPVVAWRIANSAKQLADAAAEAGDVDAALTSEVSAAATAVTAAAREISDAWSEEYNHIFEENIPDAEKHFIESGKVMYEMAGRLL